MAGPVGYQELPPFIGTTGREKLLWRVSWLNAITFMGSLIVGREIGALLFGRSLWGLVTAALIIVGAVTLTCDYHGLLLGRRLLIWLRFVARALCRRTTVTCGRASDGQADPLLDATLPAAPQPVLVAARSGQGRYDPGLALVGPALDDAEAVGARV